MKMTRQSGRRASAESSQTQPVSILRHRRSSTSTATATATATGSTSRYDKSSTSAVSFNRLPHNTNDTAYCDTPDRALRNSSSSFHEDSSRCYGYDHFDDLNSSAPNLGSNNNFELIRDPNELADRIIKFNNTYASSSNRNNGKGYQSSTTPHSSRSTSASGLMMQRSRSCGELKTPSSEDLDLDRRQQQRHTPEESWGDAAEEEYLGLLDQSGRYGYGRGSASTSTSEHCPDGLRSREIMNTSSLSTPPLNSHQSLGRSSTPSYADVTPLSPQNCVERGRCKLHPQYELCHQNLPKGHRCPMCFAMSHYNPKWRGKNQDCHSSTASIENSSALSRNVDQNSSIRSEMRRSNNPNQMPIDPGVYKDGDYYDTSTRGRDRTRPLNNNYNSAYPKSLSASATMSPRSRERGRSKSANRTPVNPNLIEDDSIDTSKMGLGRMMTERGRSVEQQRHLGGDGERQRRSRTRSPHAKNKDVDCNRSCRSSSRGKGLANALGNIREKLTTHISSFESTSSRHRSRSRSRSRRTMRLSDKDKEQRMVDTTSLHAIDEGKRGGSRDSMSSSYAGRPNQKSDFNNPFVPSKVTFDKKTGRCKKHPSVVLAKKSAFKPGSWEVIKQNGCPLCAQVGSASDRDRDESGQDIDENAKRKMDMLLRGSQGINGDASMPLSKKTEVRPRRSSSFSRGTASGDSTAPNQSIIDKIPEELQLQNTSVSRMLYTTPMGETGWYTGEVDFDRNPHGQGRMRYKTGHSYEGQWIHGYGEVHLENLDRMKSGFGTNKAAWEQR